MIKRAFYVQYGDPRFDYGASACIVFAKTRGEARTLGAKELECDFIDVTKCRRAPNFDKHVKLGKITDRIYIENGFGVPCPKCERPCDEYTAVYDDTGQTLKCCVECVGSA